MNKHESHMNPHCSFVNWINSVRHIPFAKSLWVVVDVVVGVDLDLGEKKIVNRVELRKSKGRQHNEWGWGLIMNS